MDVEPDYTLALEEIMGPVDMRDDALVVCTDCYSGITVVLLILLEV